MAKNNKHKKKLKSERSKVKIKAKKLAKPSNITDTNFKVKKIVIQEQLKTPLENDILSKRKLNIKELLRRLQHHNVLSRKEALLELRELILTHKSIVTINLKSLLEGLSPLILDEEKSVRRETLKVLITLTNAISINQLSPLFDVPCSYLRCAMTHIDVAIREDSLLYLDVFLSVTPMLVAQNAHNIFPVFIGLVSDLRSESKPGRMLTVNLQSKQTMVKWRMNVLERLSSIFSAIYKNEKDKQINNNTLNKKNTTEHHLYEKNITIYKSNILEPFDVFDILKTANEINYNEYADIILPLLFETWLEVCPENQQFPAKIHDIKLPTESWTLLKHIIDILHLFWNLINISNNNINIFLNKYRQKIFNHFVNRFPYHRSDVRNMRQKDILATDLNYDTLCKRENILIVYLYFLFSNNIQGEINNDILNYLKDALISWEANEELEKILYSILKTIFERDNKYWKQNEKKLLDCLDSLIWCYHHKNVSEYYQSKILALICDVINKRKINGYEIFLFGLVDKLHSVKIPNGLIDVVIDLCKRKNNTVKKSLSNNVKNIFDNLYVKLDDRKKILQLIQLLYWLPGIHQNELNQIESQIIMTKDSIVNQAFCDWKAFKNN